jgi:hypothetical protein
MPHATKELSDMTIEVVANVCRIHIEVDEYRTFPAFNVGQADA